MDLVDKDDFNYASVYRCGIKALNYFYHISFLETCKSYKLIPAGLALKKQPFIPFEDGDLIATWNETILHTEEQLLETLILGINERRISLETNFWNGVSEFLSRTDVDVMTDWLVKLVVDLEKLEVKTLAKKKKKLKKLCGENNFLKYNVGKRMDEHKKQFDFVNSLLDYGQILSEDFTNLVSLLTLDHNSNTSSVSVDNSCLETSGKSNSTFGESIESGKSEKVTLEHSLFTDNSCNSAPWCLRHNYAEKKIIVSYRNAFREFSVKKRKQHGDFRQGHSEKLQYFNRR